MKINQLAEYISDLSGTSHTDGTSRARRLREAGYIPTNGVGVNAPDMIGQHAAALIIGITAGDSVVGVVDDYKRYAHLWPVVGYKVFPQWDFISVLGSILDDPELAKQVYSVVFLRRKPQVTIRWNMPNGSISDCIYLPKNTTLEDSCQYTCDYVSTLTKINGELLRLISEKIRKRY